MGARVVGTAISENFASLTSFRARVKGTYWLASEAGPGRAGRDSFHSSHSWEVALAMYSSSPPVTAPNRLERLFVREHGSDT